MIKNRKTRTAPAAGPDNRAAWFELKNLAGETPELRLYGEIASYENSARDIIDALAPYRGQKINVRINSIGGNVFEGTTIANYLRTMDATAIVDGLAASIATRIALACKSVTMAPTAFFVIHNCWDYFAGNKEDILARAAKMAKVDKTMAQEYADKTGDPIETIEAEMTAETWFSGEEAVERGFADALTEEAEQTIQSNLAALDLTRFANRPSTLKAATHTQPQPKPQPPTAATPPQTMEKLLAALVSAGLIPSAKLDDDTAAGLVQAELEKSKHNLNTITSDRDTLQAKLDKQTADAAKADASRLIEEAMKAGKIKNDPDLRNRWIQAALKDKEGTSAMIEGMIPATPPPARRGAPPVAAGHDDLETEETLEGVRAAMQKETDPEKRYNLGLKARELRGHKELFAGK